MVNIPEKFFYNKITNRTLDGNGTVISDETKLPFAKLLNVDKNINIQLVTDSELTLFTDLESGTTMDLRVDDDLLNPQLIRTLISGSGNWTQSTATPGEYYYNTSLADTPENVYENAVLMVNGVLGSLSVLEWAYGDNDSIGEDRLYMRVTGTVDPDTNPTPYYTYKFADGTYTPLFIYSSNFNEPGTWFDTGTQALRDPDVTQGELTFRYSANDDAYFDRVTNAGSNLSSEGYVRCKAHILLFAPSTAKNFDNMEFVFLCYSIPLNDTQIRLDARELNVYTMAEVDALVDGKMPKLTPAGTPGDGLQIAGDGVTIETTGLPAGGGGGGSGNVIGPASSTDNALVRFDGITGELVQDSVVDVSDTGDVTTAGNIEGADVTATGDVYTTDEAYDATWDTALTVPTKNALYDKIETLVPKDLSGEIAKNTLTGGEVLGIDDAGVFKATTVTAIVNRAVDVVTNGLNVEFGWYVSAEEYGSRANGKPGTHQREKEVTDAEVVLLLHCDGSDGDSAFEDDSTFAHTITNEGAPVVRDDDLLWKLNSACSLDGASGLDLPVTNFDPQDSDFGFGGKFYLADANKFDTMSFIHIGTGGDTAKVLWCYIDNGFMKLNLGTDTGTGEWTETESVEVLLAGYLLADSWNSLVFQRNVDEFIVGLNGTIVVRFSLADKILNTPNPSSKIRLGYSFEGSVNGDFWIGSMDEVLLADGIPFSLEIEGVPFQQYMDWYNELYVTKKYDIQDGGLSRFTQGFEDADLAGGKLLVNHGLNESLVLLEVWDSDDIRIPVFDLVQLGDLSQLDKPNNLVIDLSSFSPITGVWRLVVSTGTGSAVSGSGAGEVNTNSNVGAGSQLVKPKVAENTPIRTITSVDNSVTLTTNTDTLDLKVAANGFDIRTETGLTRILDATDVNALVRMTNAAANTVTANVAVFVADDFLKVSQSGAGTTTIQAGAGMTINGAVAGSVALLGQYRSVELYFISSTEMEVHGIV